MSDSVIHEVDFEKLKTADENEMRLFYEQLYPKLFRYCSIRGLDPIGIDEIIGETMLRVLKKIDFVAEASDPYAYCFAIMRNIALEYHRKHRNEQIHSLDEVTASEDSDSFRLAGVESPYTVSNEDQVELMNRLEEAISKLPNPQRSVVLLRQNGMSWEEIASSLDDSVGHLRVMYSRALRSLRMAISVEK